MTGAGVAEGERTGAGGRHAVIPRTVIIVGLVSAAALTVLASLAVGTREIPLDSVIRVLLGGASATNDARIITELRVPRTVLGLVAGAALAAAGVLMQGVTRNPLADPGLLGVNAGASLGVVVGLSVFGASRATGLVLFAIVGAAIATAVVYLVAGGRGFRPGPVTLTLAGAAFAAVATSLVAVVLLSSEATFNQYRFWSVGSLSGRSLDDLAGIAPLLVIGLVGAAVLAPALNTLALGDDLARGLGQKVGVVRLLAATTIVFLCGAATSLVGPIVFLGLVVPHVSRAIAGADYRWITAYSLLLGPIVLVLADVIGRVVSQPAELEAGIVVAFIGAPVMIAFVTRRRSVSL